MKAPHTEFGKTKNVEVQVFKNCIKIESDNWDETLWVERGEDWYALGSSDLKNKKVRVIERDIWLRSTDL